MGWFNLYFSRWAGLTCISIDGFGLTCISLDGLVDCEDPECCESPVCERSQLCHTVSSPIDILLRYRDLLLNYRDVLLTYVKILSPKGFLGCCCKV